MTDHSGRLPMANTPEVVMKCQPSMEVKMSAVPQIADITDEGILQFVWSVTEQETAI